MSVSVFVPALVYIGMRISINLYTNLRLSIASTINSITCSISIDNAISAMPVSVLVLAPILVSALA